MKKIKPFKLAQFTNHALASFCAEAERHILNSLPPENAKLCDDFSAKLAAYKAILAASSETFNEAIEAADKAADRAWGAINTLLQLNVNHYDDAVADAAKEVLAVFDNIPNPTQLPYAEEYSRLESLLTQLSAIPSQTLRLAMVDGWISELKKRVDAFNDLRQTKTQARAEIETGSNKAARLALMDAYRTLADKLNAMLLITESEEFATAAKHLNELIDASRVSYKARKSAKKNAKESPEEPTDSEEPGNA